MQTTNDSYFNRIAEARSPQGHQEVLDRCVVRVKETLRTFGVRNPKIGRADNTYDFCGPDDWVVSFYSGQLWLAYQLTGDPVFREAARSRRPAFNYILRNRKARDHDLGFQFSLHSVADWRLTSDPEAKQMALSAAFALLGRFRDEGGYIQSWQPKAGDMEQARFANGRMIVDTMQNLALLYWAHQETGINDYRDVADAHAQTTRRHLVRPDGTSFHCFLFDPASGEPLRGETHQGYADDSCWARGQAWLIHGFAQSYLYNGDAGCLEAARLVAAKTQELMGESRVPVWDFGLQKGDFPHRDSSAGAVMASGLYILAGLTEGEESSRWRGFADDIIAGLVAECDLTRTPGTEGLLARGAAHVRLGRSDTMLPYGDYYFMEALMRSLGHTNFFW